MIKNFRAVGNSVSVVLDNGTKLFSNSLDKQQVDKVYAVACGLGSMTDDELVNFMEGQTLSKMVAEEKEVIVEKEVIKAINDSTNKYPSIFQEKDGAVYRKGIELSIPKFVLNKYMEALMTEKGEKSVDFRAVDNFWMWSSLNTNKYAREELLQFLKNGGFMLTPNGYFVAYRNVNIKEENNKALTDFIGDEFLRVKTKLKKATKDYIVTNTGTEDAPIYRLEKLTDQEPMGKLVGNLRQLYENIAQMGTTTVYTDAHTGKMRIKLGQEVRIPRTECDESSANSCSRGLHLKNKSFGEGFGDVTIVCLCNPASVVAVPQYDQNKLRTCAYFPMAVAQRDDKGNIIELDYSEFDDVYFNEQINKLQELAKGNKPEEVSTNIVLGSKEIKNILKNLENVSSIVKNRVVKL